jgi:hypothetical protein
VRPGRMFPAFDARGTAWGGFVNSARLVLLIRFPAVHLSDRVVVLQRCKEAGSLTEAGRPHLHMRNREC